MLEEKNLGLVPCLSLALTLCATPQALAQEDQSLHVMKATVNAESKNAELCLEFDKNLATTVPSRLAPNLRLEADGKITNIPNIAAASSSLCIFPLERGISYRLTVKGLRSADDEKMSIPYSTSFVVPDQAPSLTFTGETGGVNEFGSYEKTLSLRALNVARANIEIYRITDPSVMARVWQDRGLTALAPFESAALARSKGTAVWREDKTFLDTLNTTGEVKVRLREKVPELQPGLYLIVADAGSPDKEADKAGLTPLAAAWFTKSDFQVRAIRDGNGVHVVASGADGPKKNARIAGFDNGADQVAEAESGNDGVGVLQKNADKTITSVIASDPSGNIAFADVENLPPSSKSLYPEALRVNSSITAPLGTVDVTLSTPPKTQSESKEAMLLKVLRGDMTYAEYPLSPATLETGRFSFQAPALMGTWLLRWQKLDGTVLAEAPLRVTTNPDAARLEASAERDALPADRTCTLTIKSVSSTGKPVPLAGGHVELVWQKLDATGTGWKNYRFGNPSSSTKPATPVATFLTDLNGSASLRLALPAPPSERGLYQALLQVIGNQDSGLAEAPPVVLPLHSEEAVIGIRPLTSEARFAQNGLARFALIGVSSGGKPRDVSSLSFQVYEEGRRFAWFQDEGRWKYKPEAQLRPIGGGPLTIKADGSTVLEWPVTAGNYRLEILDAEGKVLAQTPFSSGWDSRAISALNTAPLALALPETLQIGKEASAKITLAESSVVTAIVADTQIRKIIQELRPKGDNEISFTPTAGWGKSVSVSVQARPQRESSLEQRAVAEATLAQSDAVASKADMSLSIAPVLDPSALLLRKDGTAALTFVVENTANTPETFRYSFSSSSGLTLNGQREGTLSLAGRKSKPVTIFLSGAAPGQKELRLEISGSHSPRVVRNWPMAVLPKTALLKTVETTQAGGRQPLVNAASKRKDAYVLISRLPMRGLIEILSSFFNSKPFTTEELALTVDALRHWRDTIHQAGIAPEFISSAREDAFLRQMLSHQNKDGGFSAYRGAGESTIRATAAAVTALGPLQTAEPAKKMAINWLKQRLANTWFDESEREERASAYAALAAANAMDASSLHYFSDTSASRRLSPVADAQIAAAFKQIREPDAAAFWIKKMLDENGRLKTISVLNALAATDALSSDDVIAATAEMAALLKNRGVPEIKETAALLRVIATNNMLAGKIRIASDKDSRVGSGVLALPVNDASAYRNNSNEQLHVTLVDEDPSGTSIVSLGTSVTRHIYRLNGVELTPGTRPARGEIYLVHLKGEVAAGAKGMPILVQSGGVGLRPVGCPLSPQLGTLSFIPWLSSHELSPFAACEYTPHQINVVLPGSENEKHAFSIAYFARVDVPSISELAQPQLRLLK
jgi:uncharacterized protein YfaS (alpha-2-macroglobulin family)